MFLIQLFFFFLFSSFFLPSSSRIDERRLTVGPWWLIAHAVPCTGNLDHVVVDTVVHHEEIDGEG